jgi:hypothetical protein
MKIEIKEFTPVSTFSPIGEKPEIMVGNGCGFNCQF